MLGLPCTLAEETKGRKIAPNGFVFEDDHQVCGNAIHTVHTQCNVLDVSSSTNHGGVLARGRLASFWANSPPMTIFDSLPILPHSILAHSFSTPNNPQI